MTQNCQHCSKQLLPAPTRKDVGQKKYCDVVCQQAFQSSQKIAAFLNGELVGEHIRFSTGSWQRNVLIDLFGYKCNCCGISEWMGKPLTLEVNHKDGNAANNQLSNLEFLCCNCHSQTPNFRALNKKSVRTHRKKAAL